MPNPKTLATLYIILVVALATAQALPITADIKLYGAPPYSPRTPGTTFNLYEWVVINGTVTFQGDFIGNITVTVIDMLFNLEVASCEASNFVILQGETHSLYQLLRSKNCELKPSPSYTHTGLVRIRDADKLALNFTAVPLIGDNRYVIYVTFKSRAGSRTFNATFSVSDKINITVKAFGREIITENTLYSHNLRYNFRIVVNITHPDGRPYSNTSITVLVDNTRKIARYWANRTSDPIYQPKIDNPIWDLTISGNEFTSARFYNIMVNVSNVRVNVNATHIVGYAVTGVNKGQFNFRLNVTNKLTVRFINVTAVWPERASSPPALRNKPTKINYTSVDAFNRSMWNLGDAFSLYVRVWLANGTILSSPNLDFQSQPSIDVKDKRAPGGGYGVVDVDLTVPVDDWNKYYNADYNGVMVTATLKVEDGQGNKEELPLRFIVTNTPKEFNWTIFFDASRVAVHDGSKVNLGDVIALNLTVKTHGGRTLSFTNGFTIKIYNVTRSGSVDYTSRFEITRNNNIIYLKVKPDRNAWGITKDNWRSFVHATSLAVDIIEDGTPDHKSLTLRWPGGDKSFNLYVTAKLPKAGFSVDMSTVDYGQFVRLTFNFTTYGGIKSQAKDLTLYVNRISTLRMPFGQTNASRPFISGTTHTGDGNYTFVIHVNGSKIWIPGDWYINATVGDVFGNAYDFNDIKLFTVRPKIRHSIPRSLRIVAGKMESISISSSLAWGNGTEIRPTAKLNITIVYPTSDGRSNATLTLRNVNEIAVSIPVPNVPRSYRVVVNFTYMTFGQKLYDTLDIDLTVYVSVNATISEMKNNPNLVAVAVGRSEPRGSVVGALVEDNLAAAALAAVVGTSNVFFDDELLDPNTLAYKTAAESYRYFIATGGPLVNLFSYKYNATLFSIVQTYRKVVAREVVEVGFKIMVPGDITRVYLNLTDNKYRIVYANGTVKVAGDHGKTDFAIVATLYDVSVDKYIFISFGLDWRGTVAAGRWIAANINDLDRLAGGQLVLLQWTDVNNDGSIQAGEVQPISRA